MVHQHRSFHLFYLIIPVLTTMYFSVYLSRNLEGYGISYILFSKVKRWALAMTWHQLAL